jgi:hypothetical protein
MVELDVRADLVHGCTQTLRMACLLEPIMLAATKVRSGLHAAGRSNG